MVKKLENEHCGECGGFLSKERKKQLNLMEVIGKKNRICKGCAEKPMEKITLDKIKIEKPLSQAQQLAMDIAKKYSS